MRCSSGDTRRLVRFSLRLLCAFVLVLSCAAAPAWADTLQGRVLDPAGQPVSSAEVLVLNGPRVVSSATTGADGRYGPLPLAPGRYDIVVVAVGLRLPPTVITIGATPVTQDLRTTIAALQESVLVSASQVDTTLSRTASSTSIVTRADLDNTQITSVVEALRLVPGFTVAPSGTTGAQTSIFPRGGESDYTLVLIDGVVQNAFGGAFEAAHIATANVERIEVVRGPQSALYGSGAIGGIVHLITANGGRPQVSATFEGGGYGTRAGTARASASHGAWSFGGGLDWLSSDGDTRSFDSIGGKVSNDDYSRTSASGSIAWSDAPSRRIRVDARRGSNERGFPGPYGSNPDGLFGGLDTISRGKNEHASVGISGVFRSGASLDHKLQMTWSNAEGEFLSPWDPDPSLDGLRRLSARYQLDAIAGRTGISVGAEILDEEATNSFITDDTFEDPAPVGRSNLGLFVEARPSLGDRIFATVGVRAERITRELLVGDGFRPEFEPAVIWSTNPKIAVTWLASENGDTKLRASAGTGIKAPTAFDIAFTDNQDLKPERSRSVDVGIEQSLLSSRALLDATWFYNSYDDLIITVSQPLAGASRYQTDNIANARSSGLEVGAAWRYSAALSTRVSWTWLDTAILGVDSMPSVAFGYYEVGDALVRRPRHSATVEVNWKSPRTSAFVLVHARGAMRDLEPNWATSVYTNPGRALATLGAAFQIARGLEAYGRITNAFDRGYEDVLGFPAPGRSAIIGLRVTAGR